MPQSSVREAIEAFGRGEIVVVTDDDDRENEGDLIIAAVACDAGEDGVHHPPYLRHRLRAADRRDRRAGCHLAPMVADNDAIHGTAFTVSVDYRHGTTTGISAEERTATIRGARQRQYRAAPISSGPAISFR